MSRERGNTSTKRVAQRLDDLFGAPQTYSIYRDGHLYSRCVMRQSEVSSQLIQLRFEAAYADWQVECDAPSAPLLANAAPLATLSDNPGGDNPGGDNPGGNNLDGTARTKRALPARHRIGQRLQIFAAAS